MSARSHNWVFAASGSSQRREDLDYCRGKARVLVINRTWELAPWADVLYSADRKFWEDYDTSGFKGRKIAGDVPVDGCEFKDVRAWLPANGWFNNSGASALFLAPQLKARRVILLGYDMQGPHWHPDHKRSNPTTNLAKWRKGVPALGAWLSALGVEVVNASRETAIDCFRRAELRNVL